MLRPYYIILGYRHHILRVGYGVGYTNNIRVRQTEYINPPRLYIIPIRGTTYYYPTYRFIDIFKTTNLVVEEIQLPLESFRDLKFYCDGESAQIAR